MHLCTFINNAERKVSVCSNAFEPSGYKGMIELIQNYNPDRIRKMADGAGKVSVKPPVTDPEMIQRYFCRTFFGDSVKKDQ